VSLRPPTMITHHLPTEITPLLIRSHHPEKTEVSFYSSSSDSIFISPEKREDSSPPPPPSSSALGKQNSHRHPPPPPPPQPKTRSRTSLQSQKRSLNSVANAPKVDQQKRKRSFSGSVTTLMKEKFTAHISKEDCVSFFNLCASLPSFLLKSKFKRQT